MLLIKKSIGCFFVIGSIYLYAYTGACHHDLSFPKSFLWGAAGAEFQDSGAHYAPGKTAVSNWYNWESTHHADGRPHIDGGARSGSGNDHWTKTTEDIALMKELGLTSYRFSVDWSIIEPEQGTLDVDALEHYQDFCRALVEAGIKPMITLHHFVHPLWFEKLGAFEKHCNIAYFVNFSVKMFNALKSFNPIWCTINEPGIYAMQGYIRGEFPPGKVREFQLAGTVCCNLMLAHTAVYRAIKSQPGGEKSEIGIVHNVMKFIPYSSINPIEKAVALYFNTIGSSAVSNFLRSGDFSFYLPGMASVSMPGIFDKNDKPFDFIGLNYYSYPLVNIGSNIFQPFGTSCYPGETMTDMPYRMYEAGMLDAIKELSELGLPIYITENGVCDLKDTLRSTWITKHLKVIDTAINTLGCDIRGYYYWTLVDNFEWAMGFEPRFGLYAVNFHDPAKPRTLREGSKTLQNIIALHKERYTEAPRKSRRLHGLAPENLGLA